MPLRTSMTAPGKCLAGYGQSGGPSLNGSISALDANDILLTRREAAEYLRSSIPTLERWAGLGAGPPFRVIGKKALYTLADLRRFAGTSTRRSDDRQAP